MSHLMVFVNSVCLLMCTSSSSLFAWVTVCKQHVHMFLYSFLCLEIKSDVVSLQYVQRKYNAHFQSLDVLCNKNNSFGSFANY